jgi:putative membrane protein
MDFLYVKAIHIVFVVSWFAALFYIVRLFIYATEAQKQEEPARQVLTNQLLIMQKKLWYIIGWPAMIGTFIFGFWMILLNVEYYFAQPWMWLKLIAVALLAGYHFRCQYIFSQQRKGVFTSSFKLRMFNELATVLLVAIVFLVVVKSTSGLIWGVLGLFGFAGILMLAVSLYRKSREKSDKQREETENK